MTLISNSLLPARSGESLARISTMGSRAWLVEAPGEFGLPAQRRIWSLVQHLQYWPDVESLIPGVTNLLVLLRATPEEPALVERRLHECWRAAQAVSLQGKQIDIPVCYGGEHATDLEAVCRHTGFSAQEVIRRHYQGHYTVFALGSAPGFGYLHGLDPRLATPRKKAPSLNMLKGTVTIGGQQTGVSALTGPNGWNAIGYAEFEVFNPDAVVPALMAPGDVIRFLPERVEL
ncbi:5-oxoprolinase subunit PxpB [Dickeya dianthicola]|uniref:5-oxoprolinase subunit PxpB n=1 Tax=Dickeya dianthicola TaxID=204039 RepID=UPI0004A32F38|nr:5-oxoprolinase subunit PxpB [Dickeya dianthicola]MZG42550.1 5-oxoprolinase subunit PxpB [Dickeya dianthicola]MZH98636.1 5-oxoprolinase subunit PxpB [Dickeya dianthicola]